MYHQRQTWSFQTELGLPQGSVLSPLLLSDIYSGVVCERVKFADDGTLWTCGSDTEELADLMNRDLMNRDLQNISRWTFKWRMKLNAGKTEYVLFTRNPNHTVPIVKLEDKLLKCVEETKLFGVILDKRMTFQSHLEAVERKAYTALGSLMIVGKTEK